MSDFKKRAEEFRDRSYENRARHVDMVDSTRHITNVLTAIVLGLIGVGLLLGSAVGRSPLGAVGGLVALAGPWCWMRADRARVESVGAEHRRSYARELGWVLLAIVCLVAGFALFIVASAHHW